VAFGGHAEKSVGERRNYQFPNREYAFLINYSHPQYQSITGQMYQNVRMDFGKTDCSL